MFAAAVNDSPRAPSKLNDNVLCALVTTSNDVAPVLKSTTLPDALSATFEA